MIIDPYRFGSAVVTTGPRYWVGAGGVWSNVQGSNWAATSGGAPGASSPTAVNDVFFDGASGGGAVSVPNPVSCKSFSNVGHTGSMSGAGSITVTGGNFTFKTNTFWSAHIVMAGSGARTLDTGGNTLNSLTINSTGPTDSVTLLSNLSMNQTLAHNSGIFDANNFNIVADIFVWGPSTTVNMRAGKFTTNSGTAGQTVWSVGANATINAGTSSVELLWGSAGPRTVAFGTTAQTYYNFRIAPIDGTVNITGSQIQVNGEFRITAVSDGRWAPTISFAAAFRVKCAGTVNISGVPVSGVVTLQSANDTPYYFDNLTASSFTINYCVLRYCTGTGPVWIANNTKDNFSNVNWTINPPPLLVNIVAYWKLDDLAGTDAIDAHGSNRLTQHGAPGTVSGKLGLARDYAAGKWHGDANSTLSMGNNNFTFSCWAKARVLSASNNILLGKWGNAGEQEYLLYYNNIAPGLIDWYIKGATTVSTSLRASNYGTPTVGTWMFIVCWHDATNDQMGISINDGTPNVASHADGLGFYGTLPFMIGGYDTGASANWDGQIDELACWKRVLTATEITQLYNGGAGRPYPLIV